MKTRITYLVPSAALLDPRRLRASPGSLAIVELVAAKELHVTLGDRAGVQHQTLPPEMAAVAGVVKQLHVGWVSERAHDVAGPFGARRPPGLSVVYEPSRCVRCPGGETVDSGFRLQKSRC